MRETVIIFTFILFVIISLHECTANDVQFEKEPYGEEIELMVTPGNITKKVIPSSQPVKLNCMNKSWNFSGGNVTWFYKACGPGTNRRLCDSSLVRNSDDTPICGVSTLQACSARLTLDRPSSGLYKCYIMEKKVGYVITATLVNTFQLEVMERSMRAPEFEAGPEDIVAYPGTTVTFTCKVRSLLPLHINWYKQVEKLNAHTTIQYEKKFFQSLNVTEVSIKGDLQSQLKLRKISAKDGGTYACGAINEAGIRYREAKLIVKEEEKIGKGKKANYDEWKWAIIASVIVLLILLLKCLFCWKLLKQAFTIDTNSTISNFHQNRARNNLHGRNVGGINARKRLELQPETGNETSDYEQVFTL